MENDELRKTITTKTGDNGSTAGPRGSRISKCDSFLEVVGTLDELQAVIGVALIDAKYAINADFIMKALNDLMSSIYLSTEEEKTHNDIIAYLDENISFWERNTKIDSEFVLPNEFKAVALVHWARTVTRRAERRLMYYIRESGENFPQGLIFLNRLSDALFYVAENIRSLKKLVL